MARSAAVILTGDDFSRAFLPAAKARNIQAEGLQKHVLTTLHDADVLTQSEISEHFIEAMNERILVPGVKMSTYLPSQTGQNKSTTQAGLFRSEQISASKLPSWTAQIVPVVFARHVVGGDPFSHETCNDVYEEIDAAAERRTILNQLTATAELLFTAQHRVFLFFLLVIGRNIRLLRWDRAGIIATTSVDYLEDPQTLHDYLWRISLLHDAALGFDSSATRLLPGDVDSRLMDFVSLMDPNDADHTERALDGNDMNRLSVFQYVRTMFRTSLGSDWPRYKIHIRSNGKVRNFLVGQPVLRASEVFGCGTRGYVALDCETHHFVWLKDMWWAAHIITGREGDILQKLNRAGVENVPTLVCHGNVYDQINITGHWWERGQSQSFPSFPPSSPTLSGSPFSGSKKRKREQDDAQQSHLPTDGPLRQHQHYRIAVAEVALPLKKFRNGRQLASIVLDTIKAHHQAATNPKTLLLHRDVSGGTILIIPQVKRDQNGANLAVVWTGLLSDWEYSKPVDDERAPSHATQTDQLGTYQFMPVNLLSRPAQAVRISDELESFFHVLVYYSLRHLRSNCAHPISYIDNYFHNYAGPGFLYTCGWKSLVMEVDEWLSTRFPHRPLLFRSPVDELLDTLLKCFRAHYRVLQDDLRKAAPPTPPLPPMDPDKPGQGLAPIAIPKIVYFGEDAEHPHRDSDEDDEDEDDNDETPTPEDRE
ncbi:hypothetical protein DICSQDRAFT_170786 [Dichomitus squalens LYAD-421 SS1]|uniref:Fungal-type protein kinase domain-containing protein n=1 Tax=Dichomitus squalens (strain LYAD-421) TaxID=732165 RepID=R7SXW2_DICSQ|nr:uncharacterized protein DICSQDRAFT_170786 [Dichomitus squalens LYAD-421 SS1]EJF60931.1 hypothetical protein DICSQDRAFT_170786 [Dichomitus squalens LYAD-421 SS1]